MRITRCFWLPLAIIMGASGASSAQWNSEPPQEVIDKGNAVIKQVDREVDAERSNPDAWPWAGQYYSGDGQGYNFRIAIAQKAGFVFWSEGCMGLYEVSYGTYKEEHGHLRLKRENAKGKSELDPVLYPIRWGGRRYLIPDNEVVRFCNKVNSGSPCNPRDAKFFCHVDDGKKNTKGEPTIPKKYKEYLLEEPITGIITWAGEPKLRNDGDRLLKLLNEVTRVRIDCGSEDGIRVGMRMHRVEYPNNLLITRVAKRQCWGEISTIVLDDEIEEEDLQDENSDDSPSSSPSEEDPFARSSWNSWRDSSRSVQAKKKVSLFGTQWSTREPLREWWNNE